MTDNLQELRNHFLNGNTDKLKEIYKSNYKDESILVLYDSIIMNKMNNLDSLSSFLVGICKNLARRDVAKKSNILKKEDDLRLLFYKENDYRIDDRDNEYLKRICYKAIDELSKHCRKIILAFYIDQLSMIEIANRFELANANVAKTMKAKCFKSLLKLIEQNKQQ